MKKIFTLALVMAVAITGFAQVKGIKRQSVKDLQPQQTVSFRGFEEHSTGYPASAKNMMFAPTETVLSNTSYDWQTNAASRNFIALWPDGFAVMCFTQATEDVFGDRGTGLLIWDPAVGEWEYTETRVEDFTNFPEGEGHKTGFGSISRWGENGLVIAAHSANYSHLFFCEDFRHGDRDFSTLVTLPNELEPCWPSVQCSGENLDIVHVIATQYTSTDPFDDALRYYRYENGQWTANAVLLDAFNAENMGGGGSNIACFLQYDPAKPNRVSFVLNDAWVDGKVVISEDNGATWSEKVFYQHPGIHNTFEDVSFHYPRWVCAQYDENDDLNIVYEWNGSTGEPGSGSYYPTIGGVGFWSETLPKSELCVGGIGNVGEPFIMDSGYMNSDLYYSEWYWSDAIHDPLPEYFGELQILSKGTNPQVVPWWGEMPEEYYWIDFEVGKEHGAYNSGIAAFPSFVMDGDNVYAFWSMIAGDCATIYYSNGMIKYRIFAAMSTDRGRTWHAPFHVLSSIQTILKEMVYGQVIPYIYSDEGGNYLWYCYMNDNEQGTWVQGDQTNWDNTYYHAVKVYINEMTGIEEESGFTLATMINVYPNPAQGSFSVQLNNVSDVNIYNAVGQLVKTYSNVEEVNVSLEAGVYFVNAGDQTVKVVVK